MSKPIQQQKATRLRKEGHSINVIAQKLRVSKSTVSHWCKDIMLSEEQIISIAEQSRHKATASLLRASEKQRASRLANIQVATKLGVKDVGTLSKRDIYMLGLGLYWGEGYKKGNQELGFTNSDPAIILFYIKWLQTVFSIPKIDLTLRISINIQHERRVLDVLEYWSNTTSIPSAQFTKTSLIRTSSKKVYSDLTLHFGTLRIKVRRGTNLRRRILGSLSALETRSR